MCPINKELLVHLLLGVKIGAIQILKKYGRLKEQ